MDSSITDAAGALPERGELKERRLGRIAELLGRPVEAFANGAAADGDTADASALLRHWLAITDADDRRKVLALTQSLAHV